jgi:hypothetical protein
MSPRRLVFLASLAVLFSVFLNGGTALACAPGEIWNTTPPEMGGAADVGQTLSTSDGRWASCGNTVITGYAYQWFSSGVPVGGSVPSYGVVPSDAGGVMTVAVEALGEAGGEPTESVWVSAIGGASIPPPPQNTAQPVISGTVAVGNSLTVSPGSWSWNDGGTISYQWRCNGGAIGGQTAPTLALLQGLDGCTITAIVTACTFRGCTAVSSTSVSLPWAPVSTAPPSISGTVGLGQALTANVGGWENAPTSWGYQWLRDGNAVAGAVGQSYALAAADAGHDIAVVVSACNAGGCSNARSAAVHLPAPPTWIASQPSTVEPRPAVQGQPAAAREGGWTNSPTAYTYLWRLDGQPISGATEKTYIPVAGDVGHTLSVVVDACNSGGCGAPRPAAEVAVVAAAQGAGGAGAQGATTALATRLTRVHLASFTVAFGRPAVLVGTLDFARATQARGDLSRIPLSVQLLNSDGTTRVVVTTTGPQGRFRARVWPHTNAAITVGFSGGPSLFGAASRTMHVRVRPVIEAHFTAAPARAGIISDLRVWGRLRPARLAGARLLWEAQARGGRWLAICAANDPIKVGDHGAFSGRCHARGFGAAIRFRLHYLNTPGVAYAPALSLARTAFPRRR